MTSEEPWTVTADYDNLWLVITPKKPEEKSIIKKKLKWYTVVYRRIKIHPDNDTDLIIPCKNEKQLDRKLATMLTTMNMIRLKHGQEDKHK